MSNLLPQDIHMLAARWSNAEHIPLDETLGPEEWRRQYRQRREETIAQWLATGLFAYQLLLRRKEAFAPVAHLIGTSRESTSYLDSLAEISGGLAQIQDQQYVEYPQPAFQENDFVLLGECFDNAAGKALVILAEEFIKNEEFREQRFQALLDALVLVQAVKPHNATSTLYKAWMLLHAEQSRTIYAHINRLRPWELEHGFVLALYPVCDIAASASKIRQVMDEIGALVRKKGAPPILKADYRACSAMIRFPRQAKRDKPVAYVAVGIQPPIEKFGGLWGSLMSPAHRWPQVAHP